MNKLDSNTPIVHMKNCTRCGSSFGTTKDTKKICYRCMSDAKKRIRVNNVLYYKKKKSRMLI